ncbi:MAG TPA: Rieske 2Fe-2S domain-containing protein [Acidimicrobiales bacterium]|nr:Rieske 2Fe-2S domain-containing protein [Acidimicrobiales bacterium]
MDDREVVDTNEERPPSLAAERLVVLAFTASIVAGLALAGVYSRGGQPQLEGVLLAVSLGGIGIGMVVWAKRFLPGEEIAEERGPLGSTREELLAFTETFEQGEHAIQRRSLLLKMLGGAVGALGIAALFPVRSLGPRPGRGLFGTPYRPGVRLVTVDDDPVRPDDVSIDGVITVWPAGSARSPDAPTLLIKVADADLFGARVRRDWTVGSIVAYSKLCTHTGCPVGLYQADEHQLLCPCHQSTFDVLEGAKPIFGPATRSLPQLPIGVDGQGFLIATGDFDEPIGAGFWDRGR